MCSEEWICRGSSWYEPLMLFFDRYHFRETRFLRDRRSIQKAGVIEQRGKTEKRKEIKNEL